MDDRHGSQDSDAPKKRGRRSPRQTQGMAPAAGDRLPPHSIEAELGVLGCIFLSPNDSLGVCVEKLKGGPETFYDLRHQVLYEELVAMYETKQPIDLITVPQRLKDKNQLDAVGGLSHLVSLPDATPSAANLSYYLEILKEKHLLRRMISTCSNVLARVYEHEGEVDTLLDETERDILQISEARVEPESRGMRDLVRHAITTIEQYQQRQGMLTGLATGFMDFDKMTSGMHEGEMIVIAARPSMGKTSLAMNIAEHVAIEERMPVGVFSLEMTADSLVLRLMCSRARVNLRDIRGGFIAERDFPRLTAAAGKLAAAPLYIDDTPGLSILQLRAKARRMWQQHGIKLIVIDYLQLLHSTARRVENRQQEIADISSGVKGLAKELKIPVIVLSQLNREFEKEKNRKPRMSDLRESGAIEQDADLIGLLYKASVEEEDGTAPAVEDEAIPVNLLIAKQRNGPTGDVCMVFRKSITRFENAAKISSEDDSAQ